MWSAWETTVCDLEKFSVTVNIAFYKSIRWDNHERWGLESWSSIMSSLLDPTFCSILSSHVSKTPKYQRELYRLEALHQTSWHSSWSLHTQLWSPCQCGLKIMVWRHQQNHIICKNQKGNPQVPKTETILFSTAPWASLNLKYTKFYILLNKKTQKFDSINK